MKKQNTKFFRRNRILYEENTKDKKIILYGCVLPTRTFILILKCVYIMYVPGYTFNTTRARNDFKINNNIFVQPYSVYSIHNLCVGIS